MKRSLAVLVLPLALAACSSDPQPAATATPAATASVPAAMTALCEEIVAGAMTPEDATAVAQDRGAVARIGSVDGESKPLTMDYRLDRVTLDVTDGVVTACVVG